jgi:membrane-associated protease RseP (regulator of RpoE activity)
VIVSYNGRPLHNQDEFGRWANDRSSGRVPVIVLRDGRRETVYIQYENDRNQAGGYANNAESYGSQAFLGVRFETRQRAVVSAVVPGSPAEEAGLEPGDELISINGRRISSAREATQIVASMQPGDKIDIEYSRPTREHVQAVLREHPGELAGADYRRSSETRQGSNQYDGVEQSSYDEQISNDSDQSNYNGTGTIERGGERRGNRGIFQRLRN